MSQTKENGEPETFPGIDLPKEDEPIEELSDQSIPLQQKAETALVTDTSDQQYYTNAKKYWEKVNPDDDGMLGGFASISYTDIQTSRQFLQNIYKTKPAPGKRYGLDCGAGIGRISKNLLVHFFEKVDLVEQDEHFCARATAALEPTGNLGQVYNQGLQNFVPETGKYDIIWCQWVLGHLKDGHFVDFFRRCITGLQKNGMIIIKENTTTSDKVEFDAKDFSVTRPLKTLKKLIAEAGLRIVRELKQTNFPKGLYPVYILALRPVVRS